MNDNLEKEILNKIRTSGLKPRPKLYFIIKNISFWSLSIIFIAVGGIAFASMLYKISDSYYILQSVFDAGLSISENILYLVPYFWLSILSILLILAIINFKKTDFAYRYNINIVLLLMLGGAVFLGTLMFYLGISQKTEELSQKYIPFYDRYSKILIIKKEIFAKFHKNVLGKIYMYKKPKECLKNNFKCEKNEIFFEDKIGCGCRNIYINIKK
ncbi:MAG: hypothetical protein KAI16_00405 [Candidatus Pacebacteria bacterium]|nr:hypothetical protein [Candidatus Paceibacterota bacterium]